ncbi:MAG: hypothetical protein NT094_04680 [Candidatus Staskawiczbacteria bacterium]|nr:hypothetical protein [Candidatus Staskawiczbacteria bacterium]
MIFDPDQMDILVEHSEENIEKMQDKLKDPSYLPNCDELRTYFGAVPRYSTEDRNWKEFVDEDYKIYEIYTQEFIERFSIFLAEQIKKLKKDDQPTTILEVGAGNGRLAHFLNNRLKDISPDLARCVATDSGANESKEAFPGETPVEKLDYKEALKKYKPQIVICSWMPYGIDWTVDFRKTNSVEEYILIGEEDEGCCGHSSKTWGDFSGENKPYEADNFERQRVYDLAEVQFSRIDIKEKSHTSTTNLFKRKH